MALVTLDLDRTTGVAVLRLNRPEKLNALSKALVLALRDAVRSANLDTNTRCLVVTGNGERAFCAGADLGEEQALSSAQAHAHMRWGQSVLHELAIGKPSIAALNGLALGGGLELALACDIRVAADTAELALPEAAMGTVPAWGGLPRLLAAVGASNARLIVFAGRRYSAAEALGLGLVSAVCAPDALMAHALALAGEIAGKPPQAIEQIKQLLLAAEPAPDRTDQAQARAAERLWNTPARAAALQAFIERPRSPRP